MSKLNLICVRFCGWLPHCDYSNEQYNRTIDIKQLCFGIFLSKRHFICIPCAINVNYNEKASHRNLTQFLRRLKVFDSGRLFMTD